VWKNEDGIIQWKESQKAVVKHYGEHLTFGEVCGHNDVVILQNVPYFKGGMRMC